MNYNAFRFGLYEKALPADLSWTDRLKQAKEAGYSFMEISIDETDERQERLKWDTGQKNILRTAILETGVPLLSMCLSGHRRYPIGSSFKELRERGMELMFDAIRFASDLGVRIVQLAGYDSAVDEKSTDDTNRNFLFNLEKSVVFAASQGVVLALENIGPSFVSSAKMAVEIVNKINSPYLQIYTDIGNLNAANLILRTELQSGIGHNVGMHIKDTRLNETHRVPFGEGTVDFISAFRIIKETGYSGFLLVEMWADKSLNPFEDARNARLWIISKMKSAWDL